MPTPVEICNIALIMIGADEIRDFDKSTKRHRACETMYNHLLPTLLITHDWSFAREVEPLRLLADGIPNEYGTPYEIPVECLRPIDVLPIGHGQKWEVIGGYIYTNTSSPSLKYTKKITNYSKFSTPFVNALAFAIAAAIAPSIKQNEKFEKGIETKAAIALAEAQEADAQIGNEHRHPDTDPDNDTFVNPDGTDALGLLEPNNGNS